jgi:malonate-semialdehyde dehydrogenase (acetylating)/methylmalonate-semialdehyde dehydrogenase
MSRSYYSGSSGTPNYVDGAFVESETTIWHAVHCPADGTLLTKTPESLPSEVSAAVASSLAAFPAWSRTAPLRRAEILADLAALVRERTDDLCELIVAENGKTGADAEGDVLRGLQVLQSCSAVPSLLLGDNAVVSESVTTATYLEPIGVTVGICPFNFPAMIPLWSFPVALACGNTHILSPAPQTPGASMLLAALASDAGVPDGVLNVVHGAAPSASQLCNAPGVAAVSFVGGSVAGRAVHAQASVRSALNEKTRKPRASRANPLLARTQAAGKRVQCNMGAKNHCVVMPDADPEDAARQLTSAAFGAAGQRCMALSVAVFVGGSQRAVMPELVRAAAALTCGAGDAEDTDVPPLISLASKERVERIVRDAVEAEGGGTALQLNGRGLEGNLVGPTIVTITDTESGCYTNEIFGPVLTCLEVGTLADALEVIRKNEYGNGACILTQSGAAADVFVREVAAGQVGVNVPVPVPLPQFSFTGGGGSFQGDAHFYGKEGVRFNTRIKTVVSRWGGAKGGGKGGLSMPVLGR